MRSLPDSRGEGGQAVSQEGTAQEASQRDPAAGRGLIWPERRTQHAQGGGRKGLWPMGTKVSKVNGGPLKALFLGSGV